MKPSPRPKPPSELPQAPSLLRAALCLLGAVFATGVMLQTVFEDRGLFAAFASDRLWRESVALLGGRLGEPRVSPDTAEVGLGSLIAALAVLAGAMWAGGSALIRFRRRLPWSDAFAEWGCAAGTWWLLPGAWELLRVVAALSQWSSLEELLRATPQLLVAVCLAGSLAALLQRTRPSAAIAGEVSASSSSRCLRIVVVAACTYAVVFTAMNWQLYRGLLIPHGDTAMYEEHLWNLLHGKGFRSYLDQGLFLGEHIQVIHVLLVPLYALWPSHLLLELCSSAALASGAIPVFFLARRHSGSERAAVWMAVAYLLAFPMQFLDIAIDLKTFRPTSFVIPLLLLALDQMERGRWKTMLVLLLLTLSAQEDLAIILAPLGVWMATAAWTRRRSPQATSAIAIPPLWMGAAIAIFAAGYLVIALTVLIPCFRAGAEVHYTAYFGDLGNSPREIVASLFTKPGEVLGKLFSRRSLLYAVMLLIPCGLLPLRSLSRLLIVAPLFGVLCLMDTSRDPAAQGSEMLIPFHHFHAPLVPIIVWAAAAGLRGVASTVSTQCAALGPLGAGASGNSARALWRARFAACCALTTGLFFSLSPLGIPFWDAGSPWHWRSLYVPGERARLFALVESRIPSTARIASTDFVHPRFTHRERSYDYSQFRRKVSGYELRVPDDTDYIVIDARHRYSSIRSAADVRELKEEPDRWELLPDVTDGYFIVLRSRSKETETSATPGTATPARQ